MEGGRFTQVYTLEGTLIITEKRDVNLSRHMSCLLVHCLENMTYIKSIFWKVSLDSAICSVQELFRKEKLNFSLQRQSIGSFFPSVF